MSVPGHLRYTGDHEWLEVSDGSAAVGITAYAVEQLGDIVFVELPDVGGELRAGDPFGTVESVKAVSDLLAPVSGRVIAVNAAVTDDPGSVNADPYGAWLLRVELKTSEPLDRLLSASDYRKLLEGA